MRCKILCILHLTLETYGYPIIFKSSILPFSNSIVSRQKSIVCMALSLKYFSILLNSLMFSPLYYIPGFSINNSFVIIFNGILTEKKDTFSYKNVSFNMVEMAGIEPASESVSVRIFSERSLRWVYSPFSRITGAARNRLSRLVPCVTGKWRRVFPDVVAGFRVSG